MRRRLAPLCAVAAVLGMAPAAMAVHWPVGGGNPSRSGLAAGDAGDAPVSGLWNARDGAVLTPMVISGGGGPATQRLAYGTASGHLHLRVLETGAPVGPKEGVDIDSGSFNDDGSVFGRGDGSVGFADTSTEDRLGQLLVVHSDDVVTPAVFVAKVRLDTGELVSEDVVPNSGGCAVNASTLLTAAAAGGGRILYFTMACPSGGYLVRIPIQGDAASPASTLGTPGFALVPGLADEASPALVVLRDESGTPRYHVAVGRAGGLSIFDAEDAFGSATGQSAATPRITAAFADAGEVARTPLAPATATGQVAGGAGSGTAAPPALYVAADASGQTKVYRFVQDGNARMLRADRAAGPIPDSGRPGPGMAVAEAVTASGIGAGGTLVVTTARNAYLLRTSDLSAAGSASGPPLPSGSGFARSAPAISGGFAHLVRDGAADKVAEHLLLDLGALGPVAAPAFGRMADDVSGGVAGAPAVSRGHVAYGTAAGAFVYRTSDTTRPAVELLAPAAGATVGGLVTVTARAADIRGIAGVAFRLLGEGGAPRSLGRATQPDAPGAFGEGTYSIAFPSAGVGNGEYVLEAIATDGAGNEAGDRRRIRVANPSGSLPLPLGACANEVRGSADADRITGSSGGDRILGGSGDDRLDGAGGHDCVLGQEGDDVLAGGPGHDLLEGSGGDDVIAGGRGANKLLAGAGADVVRGGAGADRVSGGTGNDTILAGKGGDRIGGGAGRDTLKGEGGDDRISGGAGNDVLSAGGGRNRLDGGAGNDRLSAANGRRDVIVCGKGRDRVTADRVDRVSRTCERVSRRRRR